MLLNYHIIRNAIDHWYIIDIAVYSVIYPESQPFLPAPTSSPIHPRKESENRNRGDKSIDVGGIDPTRLTYNRYRFKQFSRPVQAWLY